MRAQLAGPIEVMKPSLTLLAAIGVLLSLFTAGPKLRMPWHERRWLTPVRLATLSMVLTVAGVAAAGRSASINVQNGSAYARMIGSNVQPAL